MSDSEAEVRPFTLRHFLSGFLIGWRILCHEWASILGLRKAKSNAKGSKKEVDEEEAVAGQQNEPQQQRDYPQQRQQHQVDSSNQSAPLTRGFSTLSKLSAAFFLWIPLCLFEARLGLCPSQRFVLTSYLVTSFGSLVAVWAAHSVFDPLVSQILPNLNRRVSDLLRLGVRVTEFGYGTFGLLSLSWLVYHRTYIQNFMLYKCTHIVVPHNYQVRTMVKLFVVAIGTSLLSEPFFAWSTWSQNFRQPTYLPLMDAHQFAMLRRVSLVALPMGAGVISIVQNIIPVLTCFMICATAKHVKCKFEAQLQRYLDLGLEQGHENDRPINELLEDLIGDSRTNRKILKGAAADSLCMDWPELTQSRNRSCHHRTRRKLKKDSISSMRKQKIGVPQGVCGRLFLYKSLIRTLNELKELISTYEHVFGSFHVLLICLHGILVSQWVVVGIQQTRLPPPTMEIDDNQSTSFFLLSPFVSRTCFSLLMFALANTFIFSHGDRLSNQLFKLKSQLFKVNTNLIYYYLNNNNSVQHHHADPRKRVESGSEIELLWSLYDQVERISLEAIDVYSNV